MITISRPQGSRRGRDLLIFAGGLIGLQELGLLLAVPPAGTSALWPASGFVIGFLAWCRPRDRVWVLGTMVAINVAGNLLHGIPVVLSLGFALAYALEGVLGAWLLSRGLLSHGSDPGRGPRWLFLYFAPAALLSPIVSTVIALSAVAVVMPGVGLSWQVALSWYVADAVGIAVVVPLMVGFLEEVVPRRRDHVLAESVAAYVVVLASLAGVASSDYDNRAFWLALLVIVAAVCWTAVRCSRRLATTMASVTAMVIVVATGAGAGPLARIDDPQYKILILQLLCLGLVLISAVTSRIVGDLLATRTVLELQSAAIANAMDGVAFVGPDGRYHRVNPSYAALLGTCADDLLGRPWSEVFEHADLAPLDQAMRRGVNPARTVQIRVHHGEGPTLHVEMTVVSDQVDDRALRGHHVFLRDVTERRRTEREASRLFEMNRHPLAISDGDRIIRRVNAAWTDQFGYRSAHLIGHRDADFVHPDDLAMLLDARSGSQPGEPLSGIDLRFRVANGGYRTLRWDSVYDPEDDLFYATAVDVTEDRRAEEALALARDHAVTASQMKSQFLATMSHEIRTPLNGVLGLSHLLNDSALDDDQRRLVNGIRSAGTSLLAVINDILDFSKIESGMLVLDEHDFRPAGLMDDVIAMLQPSAIEKNLELIGVQGDLPAVLHGDAGRLQQVLVNLVGNALKFTEVGAVRLETRLGAERGPDSDRCELVVEVSDTGIGMDDAALERIFTPFVQANSSDTRRYGGTGLGLSITRELVELMGGQIDVTSQPGRGSRFTVTLPFRVSTCGEAAEPGSTDCAEVADSHARRATILLVEDNEINQQVALGMLAHLGYEVDLAVDGLEALEMAERSDYQVILMDCQMPRMDGYAATARLRVNDRTARIPIIAMTANAFREDRERCLAAGMDDYLAKPVRRDALGKILERWVDKPGGQSAESEHGEPSNRPRSSLAERWIERVGPDRDDDRRAAIHAAARSFATALPSRVAEITRAIEALDGALAVELARDLEEVAVDVCADRLAEVCVRLQQLGGLEDRPALAAQVHRLRAAEETTIAEIAVALADDDLSMLAGHRSFGTSSQNMST